MIGGIMWLFCSKILLRLFLHPYPRSFLFAAQVKYLRKHSYKEADAFSTGKWDTHTKWIQY